MKAWRPATTSCRSRPSRRSRAERLEEHRQVLARLEGADREQVGRARPLGRAELEEARVDAVRRHEDAVARRAGGADEVLAGGLRDREDRGGARERLRDRAAARTSGCRRRPRGATAWRRGRSSPRGRATGRGVGDARVWRRSTRARAAAHGSQAWSSATRPDDLRRRASRRRAGRARPGGRAGRRGRPRPARAPRAPARARARTAPRRRAGPAGATSRRVRAAPRRASSQAGARRSTDFAGSARERGASRGGTPPGVDRELEARDPGGRRGAAAGRARRLPDRDLLRRSARSRATPPRWSGSPARRDARTASRCRSSPPTAPAWRRSRVLDAARRPARGAASGRGRSPSSSPRAPGLPGARHRRDRHGRDPRARGARSRARSPARPAARSSRPRRTSPAGRRPTRADGARAGAARPDRPRARRAARRPAGSRAPSSRSRAGCSGSSARAPSRSRRSSAPCARRSADLASRTPMAEIVPFRAVRYAATRGRALGQLLAPPYDLVSQEQRDELLRRSPHNIIHVTLGEDRPGDGPATTNKYVRAGETWRAWLEQGVLRRDPTPALYPLEQSYLAPDGRNLKRRGFMAAVRLHEFTRGRHRPAREDARRAEGRPARGAQGGAGEPLADLRPVPRRRGRDRAARSTRSRSPSPPRRPTRTTASTTGSGAPTTPRWS